jgi:hypothetical protein
MRNLIKIIAVTSLILVTFVANAQTVRVNSNELRQARYSALNHPAIDVNHPFQISGYYIWITVGEQVGNCRRASEVYVKRDRRTGAEVTEGTTMYDACKRGELWEIIGSDEHIRRVAREEQQKQYQVATNSYRQKAQPECYQSEYHSTQTENIFARIARVKQNSQWQGSKRAILEELGRMGGQGQKTTSCNRQF